MKCNTVPAGSTGTDRRNNAVDGYGRDQWRVMAPGAIPILLGGTLHITY